MMRSLPILACVVALAGCQTMHEVLPGNDGGMAGTNTDADMDFVSDAEEGRSERRDTDGDGIADYLDTDSDNDGIPDRDEAGDQNVSTPPRDSDMDDQPDYIDSDSDNNGIPDSAEGGGDFDLDGIPDYADLDDDNDFVRDRDELAGILNPPADTDRDGRPNYQDPDSDDDLIIDGDDGAADTDEDGLLDWEDLDSDNDGIPDRDEAGDDDVFSPPFDSDGDGIPDFRDPDSDNDGLSDRLENRLGTDPRLTDSDGDGVDDLIEQAAGTDALDPEENPRTRGDFVFVVDFEQDPQPPRDTLEFRTSIQFADIYFLFDISGSMSSEIDALRMAVTTVVDNLTCTSFGTSCRTDGDCSVGQVCSLTGACIEDPSMSSCVASPFTGGGYYEDHMVNLLSVQDTPSATASALSVSTFGSTEQMFGAVWSVVDPEGSPLDEMGCDAPGMPGRIGCVGFRDEAVRILVAFSDEDSDGSETVDQAATALNDAGVTFIGVWSGTAGNSARSDMVDLAERSGSLDRTGAPLVFDGQDSAVVPAVTDAINEIVEGVPLRVTIEASDEPDDAGDALQFIDYVEVNVGGGRCSAISPTEDTNGDSYDDAFPSLLPGTPVCWDVVPRRNETVPREVDNPQVFEARLTVSGDGSPLDARIVYFLVPPAVEAPGGPD